MDEDKFLKEDAIRKAAGMSETDRLDFLIAEIDKEHTSEIAQRYKESSGFAKKVLGVCFFLLIFLVFFT